MLMKNRVIRKVLDYGTNSFMSNYSLCLFKGVVVSRIVGMMLVSFFSY